MTMNRSTLSLAAACLLLGAGTADAQKIYKCKNEKGETFYSQAYDPKLCGGGGAQLNEAGIAVRQIERRKTPEELAAEAEVAALEAEQKRLEAERKRKDDILMQSYPTEAELELSHEQELRAIDGVIRTQEMSVASYEETLEALLAQAAETERAGRPVPAPLAERIDRVRADLESQREAIDRKRGERAEATTAFESRLARYRELKARQEKHLSRQ